MDILHVSARVVVMPTDAPIVLAELSARRERPKITSMPTTARARSIATTTDFGISSNTPGM
jgi:hypothetical protein